MGKPVMQPWQIPGISIHQPEEIPWWKHNAEIFLEFLRNDKGVDSKWPKKISVATWFSVDGKRWVSFDYKQGNGKPPDGFLGTIAFTLDYYNDLPPDEIKSFFEDNDCIVIPFDIPESCPKGIFKSLL